MPDMYAQARGHAVSKAEWEHIRQSPTSHVTYVMYVTLLVFQKSAKLVLTALPLYIMKGAIYMVMGF